MSLGDDDMNPMDAHRIELRAAMRRQHEADLEAAYERILERDLIESPEAEEARWGRIFERMAAECPQNIHYARTRQGIDPRLWGP